MVVVAQLVELLVVVQAVAGSNPVDHPAKEPLESEGLFPLSAQNRHSRNEVT